MSYKCVITQFSVFVLVAIPTTGKTEKLIQTLYICLIIIPPLNIITYSHETESYTLNPLRSPVFSVLYTITIVNLKDNNNNNNLEDYCTNFFYFYRCTVHSVVYLITHTNTCTYICII